MKSRLIQYPDGRDALGGAIVSLYQNGGYDERKDNENDTSINPRFSKT